MAYTDLENQNIITKGVKDILVDNAKEYYEEIICHRPIPDTRDGLTEVQRRVLFSMYSHNWDTRKPHVKSAKVIGAVVGDLHPHSDTGVYDVAVNMTQPWKNQLPMVDFHGNLGGISGASPGAMRYCITGDTLIRTENGKLIKIEDIIPNSKPNSTYDINLKVQDYKGNLVNASKLFNCGIHDTIKISTDMGIELEGSLNHPVLIMNKNFELEWKLFEDLKINDKILILNKSENMIDEISEEDKIKAIFFGGMISEGYTSSSIQKYNRVGFSNQDLNYFNLVVEGFKLYKDEFNYNKLCIRTPEQTVGNVHEITVYSDEFKKFMESNGCNTSYHKEIPDFILNSSIGFQKYFLKSLFEGDGTVNKKYNQNRKRYEGQIGYCSYSPKLLKQLQIMLLNFGIRSIITKTSRNSNEGYLYINSKSNIIKFRDMIGFISDRKNNDLNFIIDVREENISQKQIAKDNYTKLDNLGKSIRQHVIKNKSKLDRTYLDSIEGILLKYDLIKDSVPEKIMNDIDRIISEFKDYNFVTIKNIEKSQNNVYSIRVDSDDHSFITNGIISHNTEMRLAKVGSDLLMQNLRDNSVDFMPTYDNSDLEPVVLPAKYCNYLVNGAFGIAAGYAVSVLPHNPKDVFEETIKKIENPNYKVNIMPDLPTGGIIINSEEVKEAYRTGQGKCILRAKIVIDEKKNLIRIVEIPYMKTLESLMKSIKEATMEREDPKVKGKKIAPKITMIKNMKNATENNKPNILIEAKRDADLNVLVSQLYEHTMCQVTIPIIFLGTVNRNFKVYDGGVDQVIQEWIDFRRVTIQRIKMNAIKDYKLRLHIVEGIIKALGMIDKIIKDIKKSKNKAEVIEMLMEKYGFTNIQATKVSEIPLYRLGALEINVFLEEKDELTNKIEEELTFFKDKSKLDRLMIEEQKEILKKFNKQTRKTELQNISYNSEEEKINAIPDEDYLMLCTNNCFVKKLALPKTQNRGGKGISVGKLKEDDYVINSTVLNSRDSIFIFTQEGNVYKFKVYEIPTHTTANLGYNIKSLINNETVVSMLPVRDEDIDNENLFFMMATEFNRIKLMKLSEFKNVRQNGILFTRLEEIEGEVDRVIAVEKIDSEIHDSIIALNNLGNAIRVKIEDIPVALRPAFGSNLFETKLVKEGGCVTSVTLVDETKTHYFLITQNGLGKRMLLSEFECQKRVTKGKMACKLKDDDCAIKLMPVAEDDNIIIISSANIMSVPSNKISVSKRPTYGCTVKKVEGEEFIIDCITE